MRQVLYVTPSDAQIWKATKRRAKAANLSLSRFVAIILDVAHEEEKLHATHKRRAKSQAR